MKTSMFHRALPQCRGRQSSSLPCLRCFFLLSSCCSGCNQAATLGERKGLPTGPPSTCYFRQMPHLLMQTKFPAAQTSAEINFYGVVDPKTMQAVEDATREAMLTTVHPPGQTEVCQHPQASNVT